MSQSNPVAWFADDPKPSTFFFRSPFRSGKFIVTTVLLAAVCAGAIVFAWKFTQPGNFPLAILSLVPLALYPYIWALRRHATINELYVAGKLTEQSAESPTDQLLRVAEDSLSDQLFFSTVCLGLLLLAVYATRASGHL